MDEPMSPKSPVDPPDNMISREQLRSRFRNFDDPAVYREVVEHGKKKDARNFVVQFGGEEARVAMDLGDDFFECLMKQDNTKDVEKPIRWINIWNPSTQDKILGHIATKYRFSTRLKLTIQAWDLVKKERARRAAQAPSTGPSATRRSFSANVNEAEKGAASIGSSSTGPGATTEQAMFREQLFQADNMATFALMQEQMNFNSIDQEKQFMCIGANWLHKRPEKESSKPRNPKSSIIPPYHFSWFALCGDNTVLSFHEAEYENKIPKNVKDKAKWEQDKLENTRLNTMKVLRQLSKVGLKESERDYMQLTSVRMPLMAEANKLGRTAIPEDRQAIEGSSNLFYYLFEDYAAAYPILQSSKARLEELKGTVLSLGQRKHHHKMEIKDVVPQLHKLHGELRQLKHLFSSYKTLISRILKDKQGLARHPADDEGESFEDPREKLSTRARDRFERLRDRLDSMMLETIQEYLDEKDSLQQTYFNFLQQTDSEATARLTRSATLLAKLSVFFLPISFLTSFYSIQLEGFLDGETKEKYWTIFGVLTAVSVLALFGFSRLLMFASDKLDGYTAVVEGKIMNGFANVFPKFREKKEEDRKRLADMEVDD